MGLLLPEPFRAPFLLVPFWLLHSIAVMAARQTVSKATATPPTTVTRLTSELGRLSSRGRTPSGGTRPWGTCFLWVRSRAMCWIFVPRLLSAPISHARGGGLLTSLLFRAWFTACGFPALTKEWCWYSVLLLPMPRLALSFDLTV